MLETHLSYPEVNFFHAERVKGQPGELAPPAPTTLLGDTLILPALPNSSPARNYALTP